MASAGILHLTFVYGTLKSCQKNADVMRDTTKGKAIYLGKGKTTSKYPLVVATEYHVPFLLKVPGEGYEIEGEVYEVDDGMLKFLDKFEGHPDLYRREEISVQVYEDKDGQALAQPKDLICSVYFLSEVKEDFLQLNWLQEYKSVAKSDVAYVERTTRHVPLKALVFPDKC